MPGEVKFATYEYTAPAAWASYWINADPSGLTDSEIAAADKAFETIASRHPGAGPHPVDCSEPEFMHRTDFSGACDACTYTFLCESCMSPFAAIHETNIHHACFLAQAFISARSEEELFAILRFADSASGRSGGYFAAYLHGKHFAEFTDRNGDFLPGGFAACQDAAYVLRDESNAEWSLYFNV